MSSVTIARPRTLVLADLLPGTLLRDVLLVVGGAAFVGGLAGMTPFLAGDAIKAVIVAGLLPAAWMLAGRSRPDAAA